MARLPYSGMVYRFLGNGRPSGGGTSYGTASLYCYPDEAEEVDRVERLVKRIGSIGIKPGVNLLVGADKVNEASTVYQRLGKMLSNEQIILVPQRFSNTPTPKQLSQVAGRKPFQSPSCLLGCKRPENFCSVSWDKKVNSCSFAQGKVGMETLDYKGMMQALEKVEWKRCVNKIL